MAYLCLCAQEKIPVRPYESKCGVQNQTLNIDVQGQKPIYNTIFPG